MRGATMQMHDATCHAMKEVLITFHSLEHPVYRVVLPERGVEILNGGERAAGVASGHAAHVRENMSSRGAEGRSGQVSGRIAYMNAQITYSQIALKG